MFFIAKASSSTKITQIPFSSLLLVVLAATFWAYGNILTKIATNKATAKGEKLDIISLVVWSALIPPIPIMGVALLIDTPQTILMAVSNLDFVSIFSAMFLAYAANLFGYGVWSNLVSKYPLGKVAPLTLLVPITGLITARIVLFEELSKLQWLGAFTIFLGLIVNNVDFKEIKSLFIKQFNKQNKACLLYTSANNPYLELLNAVIKSQAQLIAKWQLVGFIHGVMNTDNMAISGETIDYGPCAFMDTYDPKTVFSSIDLSGRYSYKNQPAIGKWNLMRFAHTLIPLIDKNQDRSIGIIQDAISNFTDIFQSYWLDGMRAKLGIFNKEKKDESIVKRLLELMEKNRADFTITFRDLSQNKVSSHENDLYSTREFIQWYKSWQERLARQSETTESSLQLMKNNNPSIIPRNHRVEEALDAAVDNGDFYVMNDLLNALANPYEYSNYQEKYSNPPPCTDKPYMTFCGT